MADEVKKGTGNQAETTKITPGLQPGLSHPNPHTAFGAHGNAVRAGPGRRKGSQNKVTNTFREAMLLAAQELGDTQEVGKDGQGGLLGYLKVCGVLERKTFMLLMGRILPLKISAEVKQVKETMTIEEAVADLKAAGMEPMLALYLQRYPLERDDEDAEWAKMIDVSLAPDPLADTVALEESVTKTPKKDDTGNDTE
jgi:hypothetical protein